MAVDLGQNNVCGFSSSLSFAVSINIEYVWNTVAYQPSPIRLIGNALTNEPNLARFMPGDEVEMMGFIHPGQYTRAITIKVCLLFKNWYLEGSYWA
jgi:hypothetical protein